MEKRIVIISLIMLMFIFPFISGETSGGDLIGKQNEVIVLPQECADCTYVKLTTVTFPNMSKLSIQVNMDQDLTSFAYNFTGTESIGTYTYCTVGDIGGINTTACNDFEITITGALQTTSQGIASAIYLLLMLSLTTLFLYMGFKLSESEYLWILGIFSMFLFLVFVVYDVWLGYQFHLNLSGMTDGSRTPEIIFYTFMFLLVSGSLTSLGLLFLKWKKIYRYIKREIKSKEKDDFEDDFEWNQAGFHPRN